MADIKVSEFIVNELSEEKLEELKDTNAVPPNEMFLTDEEGEQFTRGLPLGTIVVSTVEIDDPYLQKADGRSLAQDGMYAEFCTWLKNRVLANSSNVPTCTIEEYANSMSTYSQCGKYVINDTSETIRSGNYSVPANSIKLPTLVEFVASNNGGKAIGLAELDEFKSHAHGTTMQHTASGGGGSVGVAWIDWGNFSGVATGYTGGEETRSKNIRYPYYIVVATATKTDVQINLDNVANEINTINSTLAKTEQVEVVYDMSSNDPNINWGYTDGVKATYGEGITINNKNFSKYKKLKITCGNNFTHKSYGVIYSFEVDLTKSINGIYRGTVSLSSPYVPFSTNSAHQDARRAIVTINNSKTEINYVGVYAPSATSSPTSYDGEILIKIEGVY